MPISSLLGRMSARTGEAGSWIARDSSVGGALSANSSETWGLISRAYQVGNWYEAMRLARSLADSDPHTIGVRQLLAALYTHAGNPRMAQVQYERLLPLAVGQGDLLGALAAQKHLDRASSDAPRHAGRFAAMHKWFRSLGRPGLGEHGERASGLTQADLLGLPVEVFSQVSEATEIETLGMSPRTIPVRTGALRIVLYGRITWTLETGDGTRLEPRTAERGESILVDRISSDEAWLVLVPEAPSECLCFDAETVVDMVRAVPALTRVLGDRLRVETTVVAEPVGAIASAEVEQAVVVSASAGEAEASAEPPARPLGHVERSIAPPPSSTSPSEGASASEGAPPSEGASPREGAPPSQGAPTLPPSIGNVTHPTDHSLVVGFGAVDLPLASESGPADAPTDDSIPSDPGERVLPLPSTQDVERRRDPRVEVGLISRVALLGIAGHGLEPLRGRLVDLSISGMAIQFPREQLMPSYEPIANALVAIDLEFPPPAPPLTLAGRVRHLRIDGSEGMVLIGVEFVLSTEVDRSRLLEAVNQTEQAGPQAA
jgi:PilZ domain